LEVSVADVGGEVFEGMDQTDDDIEDQADEAGGADAGETSRAFIELVQGGRSGVEREGRGYKSQGEIGDEKGVRFSERRDPANGLISYPCFSKSAPRAVACLEAGFEDAMAVKALPEKYRKRLRTTNMQERLNEEIRRRERVIRIFPNDASVLRLIGALLAEKNEVWQEKKYLDMEAFKYWAAARPSAGQSDHLMALAG